MNLEPDRSRLTPEDINRLWPDGESAAWALERLDRELDAARRYPCRTRIVSKPRWWLNTKRRRAIWRLGLASLVVRERLGMVQRRPIGERTST